MRPHRMVLPVGLAATVLLAGCGAGGNTAPSEATPSPSAAPPTTVGASTAPTTGDGTALTVTVVNPEPVTYQLTCEPTGGDHPRAESACAELLVAEPSTWQPVPPNDKCAMFYGGPQEATVTGTIRGAALLAHFSRTNSCQIGRWDALPELLGPIEN